MKNIVFIINVEKPGQTKPEYQFSIDSWKQWCDTVDRVLCHGLEECDADRLRGTACCERYVSDSFDCRVPRTHILQGAECRHFLKSQWPATFAI